MRNRDANLTADETIVYQTPLHWAILVPPFITGAALCVAGAVIAAQPRGARVTLSGTDAPLDAGWAGIAVIVVGILVIGFGLLRRESTQLTVTNRRVTVSSGVIMRRTLEILLPKVESIEVDQGLWGRLLGYGTIVVRGTGGTPEPLALVPNPEEFRRQVLSQLAGPRGAEQPVA